MSPSTTPMFGMVATSSNKGIKMDGPTIPFTVNDLFRPSPRLFMVYHVASAGYDIFTPMGAILGGGVGLLLKGTGAGVTYFAANGGLVGGALGISMGLAGLYGKASQGEALEPLPWNDDGIKTRVDGLAHN
jgi:hypothetical protein